MLIHGGLIGRLRIAIHGMHRGARVAWYVQVDDNVLDYSEKVRQHMNIVKSYLCRSLRFKTTNSGTRIVEFDLDASMCVEAERPVSLREAREKGYRFVIDVVE